MKKKIKNSVHPGEIVKPDCLEALGLSVTLAAKVLGVTRQTLSRVVNCQSSVSSDMASVFPRLLAVPRSTGFGCNWLTI